MNKCFDYVHHGLGHVQVAVGASTLQPQDCDSPSLRALLQARRGIPPLSGTYKAGPPATGAIGGSVFATGVFGLASKDSLVH